MDKRNPEKSTNNNKTINLNKASNLIVKTGIMATLAVLSYVRITDGNKNPQPSSPQTAVSGNNTGAKTVYTGTHFNKYLKHAANLANSSGRY